MPVKLVVAHAGLDDEVAQLVQLGQTIKEAIGVLNRQQPDIEMSNAFGRGEDLE